MNNKNVKIQVYLSPDQVKQLDEVCTRAGSERRSSYIRRIITAKIREFERQKSLEDNLSHYTSQA